MQMKKKTYIAGKITGDLNYKEKFKKVQYILEAKGYIVLNPAELPEGMEYEDYMEICFAMIRQVDEVHFLEDWRDSKGAIREWNYAKAYKKKVVEL